MTPFYTTRKSIDQVSNSHNDGAERAVKASQEVSCAATIITKREDVMVVMSSHRTNINYKTRKAFLFKINITYSCKKAHKQLFCF